MKHSKSKLKFILIIISITVVISVGIGILWSIFSYKKFDSSTYKMKIASYIDKKDIEKLDSINNALDAKRQCKVFWNNYYRIYAQESGTSVGEFKSTYPIKINVYYDNELWLVCQDYLNTTYKEILFDKHGNVLYSRTNFK